MHTPTQINSQQGETSGGSSEERHPWLINMSHNEVEEVDVDR